MLKGLGIVCMLVVRGCDLSIEVIKLSFSQENTTEVHTELLIWTAWFYRDKAQHFSEPVLTSPISIPTMTGEISYVM